MNSEISAKTVVRVAQLTCAGAFVVVLWTMRTAARTDVPAAPAVASPAAVQQGNERPRPTDADVARAVAGDLFADDRAAPTVRYRIGAAEQKAAAFAAPAVVPPQVQLAGTVVAADGRSFAMCQTGAEPAKIVYVGQRVGTLTLRAVNQGSAVFTDDSGKQVVLRVPNGG